MTILQSLKEQNKLFWLLLGMSIMFIAIYAYESIYITVDFKRIDETIESKYVIMHIEWKDELLIDRFEKKGRE